MTINEYNIAVDKYADALLRFMVFTTRNRDESRDIVQESFLRLWERREFVKPKTSKSYLFTIAYNLAVSYHRALRNRVFDSVDDSNIGSYSSEYDNTNEIVWQELEKLPLEDKTIIILRDWEGYSYKEIENITKLSASLVKVKIHRVREKLQSKLNRAL